MTISRDEKSLEQHRPAQNNSIAESPSSTLHDALDTSLPYAGDSEKQAFRISKPELGKTLSNTLSRTVSRITNRDVIDPGPPPDGGWKAWLQVFMAWIVCFTTWGYLNSFGVFQTYYTDTLGEEQSTISWIGSIQLFVIFFVSTFSGRALDAGLLTPTLIVGSVIQLVGIFTNSICKNFWQLVLAQGLCTGLGSGIIFCPAMGLVTTYFSKHRALAIATVSSGNSVGGMVYPIVVRHLLPRIGFAWTVRVLGFINLGCLCMAIAFLRPRLPPRKAGPIVEWEAFREVPYVSTVIGMSFVFGGIFFSYYFLGSYGRTVIGMSYEDSTTLVIIFNGSGLPIRFLVGTLVDRFTGPLNCMVPLLFINALFAFAWIGVQSELGVYIFAAFYGTSAAAFQCLLPTTVASLNKDMSKNGVRMGMAFSIFSFAGLTGPPIGGALLNTNGGGRGGYLSAQLGIGIATVLGACLVLNARVHQHGWSLKIRC